MHKEKVRAGPYAVNTVRIIVESFAVKSSQNSTLRQGVLQGRPSFRKLSKSSINWLHRLWPTVYPENSILGEFTWIFLSILFAALVYFWNNQYGWIFPFYQFQAFWLPIKLGEKTNITMGYRKVSKPANFFTFYILVNRITSPPN